MDSVFDIEEIKKVKLDPPDIIVLRIKDYLSLEAHKNMKACLESAGFKNKIMILEGGIDMSILTEAELCEILPK